MRRSEKNKRQSRTKNKQDRDKVEQPLESLLEHLKITRWDYLLVGDGSGTVADKECGWACVMVNRDTMRRNVFHGGASHGTNITAEIMAYVQPLLYLTSGKLPIKPDGTHVHVVTDCQHLVNAWRRQSSRRKHRELWGLMDSFTRRGLVIHFHWIPRDTWQLNQYCDALAGRRRLSQMNESQAALKDLGLQSIHDVNPMTE